MAFTVAIGLLDISTSVGYLYTILQERRDYINPSQHAARTHAKTYRILLLSQRYSTLSLSSSLLPRHINPLRIGAARTTLPNSPTPWNGVCRAIVPHCIPTQVHAHMKHTNSHTPNATSYATHSAYPLFSRYTYGRSQGKHTHEQST